MRSHSRRCAASSLTRALANSNIPQEQERELELAGKELGDEDPRLMPAANVVRWRWGIDEQGNRVKESNARIVKWSDGTTQLLIGGKVALDAVARPIKEHHAVFAKLGAGVIEEQTVVTESLHLRPTGDTRRAFNKHKNSVISSKEAAKKIRKVVIKPAVDEKEHDRLRNERFAAVQKAKKMAKQQQKENGLTTAFLVRFCFFFSVPKAWPVCSSVPGSGLLPANARLWGFLIQISDFAGGRVRGRF